MVAVCSWFNFFDSQGSDENCYSWCNKMGSIFVYLLLPMAGLIMLWLRKECLSRILIHIDGFYLPILLFVVMLYPPFGRGKTILKWARRRLPQHWSSHMDTLAGGHADFWKDGSLLCTLINSAIPGACANPYRHWKKPPDHAQDVAYKYLGIMPVFIKPDFSSHLSPYLETKLLNYLCLIRKSINILEKEKFIHNLISPKFVARGMGLYTAEQFKESEFFVYSKYDNESFFNIEIAIVGPYSIHYKTTVLEYLGNKSKTRNNKNKNEQSENISLHVEMNVDKVRIAYIPKYCGIHEISLNCNKESIMGSPFFVNVLKYSDNSSKCDNTNLKKSEVQTEATTNTNTEDIKVTKDLKDFNSDNISKEEDPTIIKSNTKINKEEIMANPVVNESNKNLIDNNHPLLEISKCLKDLSNSYEKQVTITKNSLPNNHDKMWSSCPDFFTHENYSYFQKLVDCSFRETCRVTRASHRSDPKNPPQFPYASPVCSDHIVPEGVGKLSVDKKRKLFALPKLLPENLDETHIDSSFSINENKQETPNEAKFNTKNNKKYLKAEETCSLTKKQKSVTNEYDTRIKSNTKKRSLQKMVQEKKIFWESAFRGTKSGISKDTESDKALDSDLNFRKNKTEQESGENLPNTLKHVDSIHLIRKHPLSKSLSDLRRTDWKKKLQPSHSSDEDIDACSKVSLEDRTKLYLENVKFVNGELVDAWKTFHKIDLSQNWDRGIFRNKRKNIR